RIGHQLGIADDDPRRAEGVVLHLLVEAIEAGHSALPPVALQAQAAELGVPPARAVEAVRALDARRLVSVDRGLIYPPPLLEAERTLSSRLAHRVASGVEPIDPRVLDEPSVKAALEPLHVQQRKAVRTMLDSSVLVLTGGPGTGKTTTVNAIVAVMKAAGKKIALAATYLKYPVSFPVRMKFIE
ncbi:MAG: AAA family ATPase, partial [Candidatus Brocadia sp.]